MRELGDGLVLRVATPADIEPAGALLVARGDEYDATDLALVAESEGCDGIAVVVDSDGRVVSTLALHDEVVEIDDVPVPTGQVDFVATDPAFEGRGLVRALMTWGHERSAALGHLLQIMVGIPYFYRQFGYEYVQPMPPWRSVSDPPPPPTGIEVRAATEADLAAADQLQRATQASVTVRKGHTPSCWRWLLGSESGQLLVAVRDGQVVAVCRRTDDDGEIGIGELAAADDAAAFALVAGAAADGAQPRVQQRVGLADGVRARLGGPDTPQDWYYARVPRLAPLLRHLGPAFAARLDAAGIGGRDHEVLLSTWRAHVRFRVGPGGVEVVHEGGPEQYPISSGGSGVPPDAVAQLLLGPHGALGLEERLPDCSLGDQRELMATLFPPRTADLLTFYLAW